MYAVRALFRRMLADRGVDGWRVTKQQMKRIAFNVRLNGGRAERVISC